MGQDEKGREVSKPLTPAVLHTLLALASGPRHGYAISQEVEQASEGQVRMGPGTLYGSLQRMQTSGLVRQAKSIADQGGPHAERRRYYELTSAGWAALRSEARRLEKVVDLARARAVLGNS
ncbi:MAG: PadR family transcriptional regulator [Acidobacteriota bacterium]